MQGSTMEYNLEMAFMMEMYVEVLEEMERSQEYVWTRTEGLAEILERMEIIACMMDTTEQELTTGMGSDMMDKEEDMNMMEEDAKDTDIDKNSEDECLRSIHCGGGCSKDDCGVGEEEHLE